MFRLIRADIYRILRGKALYITLIVLLAVVALIVGAAQTGGAVGMQFTPEQAEEVVSAISDVAMPGVSAANIPEILAISMENFTFFLLPVVVIVAGAIFTHGTVKNDISWGTSRTKLYFSKLILSVGLCILMLIFYVGSSMLVAAVIGGFGGPVPTGHWIGLLQIFSAQLVLLVALVAVGVFLAFTTKRTAAVNGAYIAFCLVPPLAITLLAAANSSLIRLMDFDMLSNVMALANLPSMETSEMLRALGIGAFWLISSTVAGVALFRRAEIK